MKYTRWKQGIHYTRTSTWRGRRAHAARVIQMFIVREEEEANVVLPVQNNEGGTIENKPT